MIAGLVAVVGTTLAGAFLVPQIVRLRQRRDVAGVSSAWAALGLITNVAWVVYLGLFGLWAAAAAPALAVIAYATTLSLVAPLDRVRVWVPCLWVVALCIAGHFGGAQAVGVVLSVTAAVQLAPAVIAAFREQCPTGVSPATWLLAVAEAGTWALYGAMVNDGALVGYGLVTAVGSLLILGRCLAVMPPLGAVAAVELSTVAPRSRRQN